MQGSELGPSFPGQKVLLWRSLLDTCERIIDIINRMVPRYEEGDTRPLFNYKCGVRKANMCFISNYKLKKKFNKGAKEGSGSFPSMKIL